MPSTTPPNQTSATITTPVTIGNLSIVFDSEIKSLPLFKDSPALFGDISCC